MAQLAISARTVSQRAMRLHGLSLRNVLSLLLSRTALKACDATVAATLVAASEVSEYRKRGVLRDGSLPT